MDSLEFIRMRLTEIIDAKIARIRQIDDERTALVIEIEEARRMLNKDEKPPVTPPTVVSEPPVVERRKYRRKPMPKVTLEMVKDILKSEPCAMTADDIMARLQVTDGRVKILLATWSRHKHIGKTEGGHYYAIETGAVKP